MNEIQIYFVFVFFGLLFVGRCNRIKLQFMNVLRLGTCGFNGINGEIYILYTFCSPLATLSNSIEMFNHRLAKGLTMNGIVIHLVSVRNYLGFSQFSRMISTAGNTRYLARFERLIHQLNCIHSQQRLEHWNSANIISAFFLSRFVKWSCLKWRIQCLMLEKEAYYHLMQNKIVLFNWNLFNFCFSLSYFCLLFHWL